MHIETTCPACGETLRLAMPVRHRRVTCGHCRASLAVTPAGDVVVAGQSELPSSPYFVSSQPKLPNTEKPTLIGARLFLIAVPWLITALTVAATISWSNAQIGSRSFAPIATFAGYLVAIVVSAAVSIIATVLVLIAK